MPFPVCAAMIVNNWMELIHHVPLSFCPFDFNAFDAIIDIDDKIICD